jgi:hypothetical protein
MSNRKKPTKPWLRLSEMDEKVMQIRRTQMPLARKPNRRRFKNITRRANVVEYVSKLNKTE